MLLIALMLQLTCWLAGVHAQKQGWDKHFRLTQSEIETYSQQFACGMEVCGILATNNKEDSLVAATLLTQNLFTHGLRFGKL